MRTALYNKRLKAARILDAMSGNVITIRRIGPLDRLKYPIQEYVVEMPSRAKELFCRLDNARAVAFQLSKFGFAVVEDLT